MNEYYYLGAFVAASLFSFTYYRTYSRYFYIRRGAVIPLILIIITNGLLVTSFPIIENFGYLRPVIILIANFFLMPLIFKTSFLNIVFLTLNDIVKNMAMYLFVLTISAMIFEHKNNFAWLTTNQDLYYSVSSISSVLAIILVLLIDALVLDRKMQNFFASKYLVAIIIGTQIVIIAYLGIILYGDIYTPDISINNTLTLISTISLAALYVFVRIFITQISFLSIYEQNSRILKKQLHMQINHYNQFAENTTKFLKFKHDYQKTFRALKFLLAEHRYDESQELIDKTSQELINIPVTYIKYSNNLLIDALLNEYKERFSQINCTFLAQSILPLQIKLSELETIKVFYNIMENIYEEVSHIDKCYPRRVEVRSMQNEHYQSIIFINSMSPKAQTRKVLFRRNNDDFKRHEHGFGLLIIEETMNKLGGFSSHQIVKIDEEKTEFQLILNFPTAQLD